MKVCFDKSLFSSDNHLIVDNESYTWSSNASGYDLQTSATPDSSLFKFLSLYGIEDFYFLEEKYQKMAKTLGMKSPSWKHILPSEKYSLYKRKLQEKAKFMKDFMSEEKYPRYFSEGNSILHRLNRASIDSRLLETFLDKENNPNLKTILRSFEPKKDGLAGLVSYDRLKTVTGRLVVESGPQFLLIPKEYRKIVSSCYGSKGTVAYVDFVSLEPRFAKLSVDASSPEDIYMDIIKNSDFDFDRKTMKKLVLATIFGAGVNKLSEVAGQEAYAIQRKISEYFKFSKIIEAAGDFNSGNIRNYFGRPIKLKKRAKNIAINNYIQSSSVDVALIGFSKLNLPESAKPIAVVHDALVVDLLKDDLQNLESIVSTGVEIENLGHFQLGVELL